MLRIDQLRLPPGAPETLLRDKCARLLRLPPEDVRSCTVLRRAIDAREGLNFVYTAAVEVKNEPQVLRRCRDKRVSPYAPENYALPRPVAAPETRPVVVGAGPAGLFAALVLARCGARPILLERGRPVEQRQADVERFWRGGALNTESNVQFGEGGAGAFSDGKLNTGTRDLRHRYIMETLVRCGAPEDILTDAKPHVGTDKLHIALQCLRQELLSAGAELRFGARLEGLRIESGAVCGVTVCQDGRSYDLPARQVLLALGHSGTPLRCCTPQAYTWSRSLSPWACASSTGSRTSTRRSTGRWRGTPPCRPAHISCPAICPTGAAPFPSAYAPADRWWPPRRRRGGWSPTA